MGCAAPLTKAVQHTEEFVHSQLDDARSASLDSAKNLPASPSGVAEFNALTI
jgi:hypothetical protein